MNIVGWQTLRGFELSRRTILQSNQPSAVGGDPKITFGVFAQILHPNIFQGYSADIANTCKPDSVEANQPLLSSQPQIAILGLQDAINRRLRQPLRSLPDAVQTLRERSSGIK